MSNIALEAVLPPLLGYWADSRWGTGPWLVIVGGLLGFGLLMFEVVRLGGADKRPRRRTTDGDAAGREERS